MGTWQWRPAQASGRGGVDSDLCLHTGFLVAAAAALTSYAHFWSSFRWCSESPLLVHRETKRQEKVFCLFGSSRLFPGLPPCYLWRTSHLQAVFTQPDPFLSLWSDLRSPSLSSHPPPIPVGEQRSLLSWWVLVGSDPLCGNLSAFPSAPLLLHSPLWLRSFPQPRHLPSPPVKGLPRVWKLFLLHSSLPLVQVPSLFFCLCFSFFFWPTHISVEFLAFWEVWGLLPAFSWCSLGVVPRVDVFLLYFWGGRWSLHLTLPPSWRSPPGLLKCRNIKFVEINSTFKICNLIKYFYTI